MIEVIVAMLVLTIGVLGLAGTTAYIVRQVTLGDLMTERSAAFQTIIDRLQSLPYDSVTNGSTNVGVFAISWTSANDGPQKGELCNGNDEACDSQPGANDGDCDACPLKGGVTTEDEMFILIGGYFVP